MKKLIAGMTAALLATSFASAASIKIDFEEFAYDVSVGDYYNGGRTASAGAAGPTTASRSTAVPSRTCRSAPTCRAARMTR